MGAVASDASGISTTRRSKPITRPSLPNPPNQRPTINQYCLNSLPAKVIISLHQLNLLSYYFSEGRKKGKKKKKTLYAAVIEKFFDLMHCFHIYIIGVEGLKKSVPNCSHQVNMFVFICVIGGRLLFDFVCVIWAFMPDSLLLLTL